MRSQLEADGCVYVCVFVSDYDNIKKEEEAKVLYSIIYHCIDLSIKIVKPAVRESLLLPPLF